jgi:hypothetical protein
MLALDENGFMLMSEKRTPPEMTCAHFTARATPERLTRMAKRINQDTRLILLERVRIVARRYDLPFAAVEELVEAIADIYGVCPDCGRTYVRESGSQVYCPDCATVRTREANRLSQAKRRARLKPGQPGYVDLLELPELLTADTDTDEAALDDDDDELDEPPGPRLVK